MDETAETIKAQLLERINKSLWYAVLVDKSTDVDNKAKRLFMGNLFFRKMCMRICYVHFCCQPTPWLQNYSNL